MVCLLADVGTEIDAHLTVVAVEIVTVSFYHCLILLESLGIVGCLVISEVMPVKV